MEITKREVLLSIAILCIMVMIGIGIAGMIDATLQDRYIEYDTALQIDNDKEQFLYGMRTNIGNAFVYGELCAVDPVDGHGIEGQYAYVRKQRQEYRRHVRFVTKKRGEKTVTEEEYYWSWDNISSEEWHCTTITFLEVEFSYGAIHFPKEENVKTIYESGKVRYIYSVSYPTYKGTIYTCLMESGISQTSLNSNMTISETINHYENGFELIAFWIVWGILTVAAIGGFCYLENRWLNCD